MESERLLEISAGRREQNQQFSFGTGYLLDGQTALTARHVLLPPDGKVGDPVDLKVRRVNDDAWSEAQIVWPDPSQLDHKPDIALIRLTNRVELDTLTSPIGIGENLIGGDSRLDVLATGFPQFKRKLHETDQISATLKPFSGLRGGIYELNAVDRNSDQFGVRDDSQNWRGMSGAPVFAQRRLIGVITLIPRDGRFDFSAVRIETAMENWAEFRSLLPKELQISNATEVNEKPPVDRFFCLINRGEQELDFKVAHNASCAVDPKAKHVSIPIVCLLPGVDSRHYPSDFLLRLSTKVLPELEWRNGDLVFQHLPWRKGLTEPEHLIGKLREYLWQFLCGRGAAPMESDAYAELWRDQSRPRIFYSDFGSAPLEAHHADALKLWLEFLSEIRIVGMNPPIHLVILSGSSEEDAYSWISGAGIVERPNFRMLPQLDFCSNMDLSDWFDHRIPPPYNAAVSSIRSALENTLGSSFYARDFRDRTQELIKVPNYE